MNDLSLLCSNWLWSGPGFNPSNLYSIDNQIDFKDYSLLSGLWLADVGTLVFAPGQTTKTLQVDIMDDDLIEGSLREFNIETSSVSPTKYALSIEDIIEDLDEGNYDIVLQAYAIAGGPTESLDEGTIVIMTYE